MLSLHDSSSRLKLKKVESSKNFSFGLCRDSHILHTIAVALLPRRLNCFREELSRSFSIVLPVFYHPSVKTNSSSLLAFSWSCMSYSAVTTYSVCHFHYRYKILSPLPLLVLFSSNHITPENGSVFFTLPRDVTDV